MTHKRIRKFNTKDTYPEQNLNNDLCQAVVTEGGKTVWMRGQCPQNLDNGVNIESIDPAEQTHKVMQNIKLLIEEAGALAKSAYMRARPRRWCQNPKHKIPCRSTSSRARRLAPVRRANCFRKTLTVATPRAPTPPHSSRARACANRTLGQLCGYFPSPCCFSRCCSGAFDAVAVVADAKGCASATIQIPMTTTSSWAIDARANRENPTPRSHQSCQTRMSTSSFA